MALRFALVLFAGFVCGSSLHAQAPASLRTDSLGDPLPPGAVARLGTLRLKHFLEAPKVSNPKLLAPRDNGLSLIDSVIFSPDGRIIASMANRPSIRLWDHSTGRELAGPWTSNDNFFGPFAFAFSPDGTVLAAIGSLNATARVGKEAAQQVVLWDVPGAKLIRNLNDPNFASVQALVFADGGKTIVTAGGDAVRWWDVTTGKEKRSWKPFGDKQQQPLANTGKKTDLFSECALSPDGLFLAVQTISLPSDNPNDTKPNPRAEEDQDAWGFDLGAQKVRWHTRFKQPKFKMRFTFSADEKWCLSEVGPNKLEMRGTATGKLIETPSLDTKLTDREKIAGLAISPDGATLAIGAGKAHIILWKTAEPDKLHEITGRFTGQVGNSLRCLAFSPDNKSLAAGVRSDLQLFDVATLKNEFPWDGHRGEVDYLAFAPDGKQLRTGNIELTRQPNEVMSWEVASWKAISFTSNPIAKWPNIGALSPDLSVYTGKVGEDGLCIYDFATGKMLGRLGVTTNLNRGGLDFFSSDGQFFVLAGQNDKDRAGFRLFAIPSGKLLFSSPGPAGSLHLFPFAFSPDDRLVAFPGDGVAIEVRNTANGDVRQLLGGRPDLAGKGVRYPLGGLSTPVFSADSKQLVSWNADDDHIRVWDLASGKERLTLPLNKVTRGRVVIAWSPDGRTLAVGDRKIQLFEVSTGKLRREFEGHQGQVRSLAFSPDGRLLASGSTDTTVLIWDVWGR
jgi:WD40 repeat protein